MRWFVAKDLDGFFGLFVDNLVQLLLIASLCGFACGMAGDAAYLLSQRILPGAAVSILLGNIFYSWQALRLARKENRDDVTALPYGINTPSLLVFVFFVMEPIYRKTGDPVLAWKFGLVACLGSGLIELFGALVAHRIRASTPRAALLTTLAGIAIGFIAMKFALEIWVRPLVAMVPLAIVLLTYFARLRFPLGMPGGLVAIAAGSLLGWLIPAQYTGVTLSLETVTSAAGQAGWSPPIWWGQEILQVLGEPTKWVPYLSVIIPMGLFNLIGSLQNIESADAAGDRFSTSSSLAANGVGTIMAALFGSCFPTTIYIGHPGWKGLGARAGYSVLNGAVITVLCLTNTVGLAQSLIPLEAGIAIVLWIGIIITAQAFQTTPMAHAPAVAIGLFPAIAAWGATSVLGAFVSLAIVTEGKMSASVQTLLESNLRTEVNGFLLHGLLVMERGYIFTCMIVAALSVALIERQFFRAAVWSFLGGLLTGLGLCHAYQVSGNTLDYLLVGMEPASGAMAYRALDIACGYTLMGLVFLGLHFQREKIPEAAAEMGPIH